MAGAESTAVARELHRLKPWDGRLYAAYGDYGENSGPTDVLSIDLADVGAGFTSEITLNTEETWTYRVAGGKLYVPFMDPIGYEDGAQGQLAIATAPGAWSVITSVTPVPIHAFGVAVVADGLFLFGAANEPDPPQGGATVWRSTDNGATWEVSLAPRPDPSGIARFYAPMIYDRVVEVLLQTDYDAYRAVYRWEDGSWTTVPDQEPNRAVGEAVPFTWQGVPFHLCIEQGRPQAQVISSTWHIRTQDADAASRDDITASIPAYRVRDAFTDGSTLWLLDQDGSVWAGDTTGTWERRFTSTVLPTCLAVVGGTAYLGTADSKLYSTPA